MLLLFELKGRTALVTGAAKGIGQAIAQGLASAGADLILLGNNDNMQETERLVAEAGRSCYTVRFDLSEVEKIPRVCADLLGRHKIDILVNNAGIIRREPAIEYSQQNWDEVINVNLNALFRLTQEIARPMLQRRQGKIINIASLLSFQGGITVPAYAASKHAVAGLTRALGNEWGAGGVQVNAIAPGYIATDNTAPLREDGARNASILSRIPAGRWGQPSDLVGAVIFLASAASDYVNGHVLVVDGGWMAR